MPSTDITYCSRNCGNMECKRNKEYIQDKYFYVGRFDECKEWKPDGNDN